MMSDSFINKKNISGGVIGALAGTLASTFFHKEQDKPVKKAAKTGLFAAIGYLVGGLMENWFRKK
jgi:uncharacterized membrane protein YebE (DUF533 family)